MLLSRGGEGAVADHSVGFDPVERGLNEAGFLTVKRARDLRDAIARLTNVADEVNVYCIAVDGVDVQVDPAQLAAYAEENAFVPRAIEARVAFSGVLPHESLDKHIVFAATMGTMRSATRVRILYDPQLAAVHTARDKRIVDVPLTPCCIRVSPAMLERSAPGFARRHPAAEEEHADLTLPTDKNRLIALTRQAMIVKPDSQFTARCKQALHDVDPQALNRLEIMVSAWRHRSTSHMKEIKQMLTQAARERIVPAIHEAIRQTDEELKRMKKRLKRVSVRNGADPSARMRAYEKSQDVGIRGRWSETRRSQPGRR